MPADCAAARQVTVAVAAQGAIRCYLLLRITGGALAPKRVVAIQGAMEGRTITAAAVAVAVLQGHQPEETVATLSTAEAVVAGRPILELAVLEELRLPAVQAEREQAMAARLETALLLAAAGVKLHRAPGLRGA